VNLMLASASRSPGLTVVMITILVVHSAWLLR